MTTKTYYPLEAFTLDRKQVWDLNVFFDRENYRPEEDIINLRGPISYYVKDLSFLEDIEPFLEDGISLFSIDFFGRVFGLQETVYVYAHKVKDIVKEHQKSLIR